MNTRKLLSTTVLYGAADVIVMAVGGFLLLPLYTRTLSQAEFGTYVVVRANTEIFTYVLALGLPSAVSRVYFDYKKLGQQAAYVSSVLLFFLLGLLLLGVLLVAGGSVVWTWLSPTTPTMPYLAFSVGLAAVSFVATMATLWLRLDARARAFALLQVATSLLLAGLAVLNLMVFDMGLPGLLWAMLLSSAASGLMLPWLLRQGFRLHIDWAHIRASMPFAGPILLGYLAYFMLNRISTLVLQRHVPLAEMAVFGLSQQLALIVTVAAGAFGKAQQPAVFSAEPAQAAEVLARAGSLLRLLMFGITCGLILFSAELFALVAPRSYGGGLHILLILLLANFAYSFSQVSDMALMYHRRPMTSVAVSIGGALLSAGLSLWLVPSYHLIGAALAIAGTFTTIALLSHWLAWRITGQSYLVPMLWALAGAIAVVIFTAWLQRQGLSLLLASGLKLVVGAALLVTAYLFHTRKQLPTPCVP